MAGEAPLTEEMLENYTDYLELTLNLSPFTPERFRTVKELFIESWKKKDTQDRRQFQALLRWFGGLHQESQAEVAQQLKDARTKLIAQLRGQPDDPAAKWLVEAYTKEQINNVSVNYMTAMMMESALQFERLRSLHSMFGGH